MNSVVYASMSEALLKEAEEEKKSPLRKGLRSVGVAALGAGLGAATGYGIGELANHIARRSTGNPLPAKYVIPAGMLLGGAAGLATDYARKRHLEDLRDADKGPSNKS